MSKRRDKYKKQLTVFYTDGTSQTLEIDTYPFKHPILSRLKSGLGAIACIPIVVPLAIIFFLWGAFSFVLESFKWGN